MSGDNDEREGRGGEKRGEGEIVSDDPRNEEGKRVRMGRGARRLSLTVMSRIDTDTA